MMKEKAEVEVLTERPLDNAPVGGVKGDTTSSLNIIPFVTETVSTISPQEMCVSIETQFRQLADVTRSYLLAFNRKDSEVAALSERLKALEDKLK